MQDFTVWFESNDAKDKDNGRIDAGPFEPGRYKIKAKDKNGSNHSIVAIVTSRDDGGMDGMPFFKLNGGMAAFKLVTRPGVKGGHTGEEWIARQHPTQEDSVLFGGPTFTRAEREIRVTKIELVSALARIADGPGEEIRGYEEYGVSSKRLKQMAAMAFDAAMASARGDMQDEILPERKQAQTALANSMTTTLATPFSYDRGLGEIVAEAPGTMVGPHSARIIAAMTSALNVVSVLPSRNLFLEYFASISGNDGMPEPTEEAWSLWKLESALNEHLYKLFNSKRINGGTLNTNNNRLIITNSITSLDGDDPETAADMFVNRILDMKTNSVTQVLRQQGGAANAGNRARKGVFNTRLPTGELEDEAYRYIIRRDGDHKKLDGMDTDSILRAALAADQTYDTNEDREMRMEIERRLTTPGTLDKVEVVNDITFARQALERLTAIGNEKGLKPRFDQYGIDVQLHAGRIRRLINGEIPSESALTAQSNGFRALATSLGKVADEKARQGKLAGIKKIEAAEQAVGTLAARLGR